MNRETSEHVAELAALLAQHPYQAHVAAGEAPRLIMPCPPHVAAREAIALCKVSKAAHRFAERQCNSDPSEAVIDRTHASLRHKADTILSRFGLCCSFQWDPRGWPLAIHASQADAEGWETCGSPRELLRVTPHA
jgi:hypothetical protein